VRYSLSNARIILAMRLARGSFTESPRAISLRSVKTCSIDRVSTLSMVGRRGEGIGRISRKPDKT
jgi:hypothetical protein